jgi:hypothetical protein
MLSKFTTFALLAVLAAGCSTTSSSDSAVFDQVRDLGQDLNRAVSATLDAETGFAEPQFAARAVDRASTTSRRLAETATAVQAPELRSATGELVAVANRIVTQLSGGDVAGAESLRSNSFVPLASRIAQLKGSLPATTQTPASSDGSSIAVAFGIIIVVILGVAGLLMRGRDRPVETSADPVERQPVEPWPPVEAPSARRWDQPHPLYAEQAEAKPSGIENADIARTTRMRPIDIDLKSLLDSTIEQARERDWMVSLVCPDVHIPGDPVRVQRAILAALGNAFLEGAELVGVVVDVVDGETLISIGHDAPIDDETAEAIAVRFATQLEAALDQPELGWSVTADCDVYLTTVSAGAALNVEAGAEASA